MTLRVRDRYYVKAESHAKVWPLPVGTVLYVQVDSYDPGTTHGMVLESHEVAGGAYNNIRGPVYSTAATSVSTMPSLEYGGSFSSGALPRKR